MLAYQINKLQVLQLTSNIQELEYKHVILDEFTENKH